MNVKLSSQMIDIEGEKEIKNLLGQTETEEFERIEDKITNNLDTQTKNFKKRLTEKRNQSLKNLPQVILLEEKKKSIFNSSSSIEKSFSYPTFEAGI